MALVVDDRIKETTTTTNTGSYSLSGAVTGFQTFSDGVGDGNTTYYCCTDGTDYEIGLGTLSGTTLARTTIIESSNSNSAVSWSAGSKDIFCTLPASKAVVLDASGNATFSGAVTFAEDVTFDGATAGRDIVFDRSDNALEFADNARLKLGDLGDLQLYHDGSHSYLFDAGTGDLRIAGNSVNILNGGLGSMAKFINGGAVELYHNASKKIETNSGGIDVTGTVTDDGATHDGDVTFTGASYNALWDKSINTLIINTNAQLWLGSGGSVSTRFYHDGSNSYENNYTGSVFITNYADDQDIVIATDDGSGGTTNYIVANGGTGEVELYHYGTLKLVTKTGGIVVYGDIDLTGTVDGRDVATDGTKLDGIEANADVTDATNVQAAGALMDSELTSEASVKAIDQGLATTDSPTFAGLTSNGDIVFEGATADDFETTVTVTDPTADRTVTLPDRTGTVLLSDLGDSQTINFQDDITFEDSLNSASADTRFYIKSNNDGVAGVDLTLWKNSDSPAVDDQIGRINFYGTDTAGAGYQSPYTAIASYIDGFDLSASRHGHIEMQTTVFGSVPVGGSTGTFTSASFHYDRTKIDVGKLQIGADGSSTTFTTDATSDQTVTLPDQTGTVMLWQSAWPDDPGSYNTAIGFDALTSLTNGNYNTATGYDALGATTSGFRNTGYGSHALTNHTTAAYNAGFADRTLYYTTYGYYNTAVGSGSFLNNTTGSYNVGVGFEGGNGSTGNRNTSLGSRAGFGNYSGKDDQVFVGFAAGQYQTSDQAVGIGAQALQNGLQYRSVAVGYDALGNSSINNAWYNVAIGGYCFNQMYSGDQNIGIGYNVQTLYNYDSNSVCVGTYGRTTANSVSIGYSVMGSALGGSNYNVCIGEQSGYDLDGGDYNIFIGSRAGYGGGTSGNNLGLGTTSLYNLSSGGFNTALGNSTLHSLTSGGYNTALGNNCLYRVTTADYNCSIGNKAGYNVTTGSNNTFVGHNAGYIQDNYATTALDTGSNVTCIGYEAVPSSTTATNEITLGDNDISTLRCNVQTISSLSDERDKTAITDLTYGLDFINDMRPVQFTWNRRDGSLGAKPDIGFIAQELYETELDHSSSSRTRLVNWSNPNKLEADYVRSYPILVKAVQELSAKCDALEARLAALEGA